MATDPATALLVSAIAMGLIPIYIGARIKLGRVGTLLPDGLLIGLALFWLGAVIPLFQDPTADAARVALLGSVAWLSGVVGSLFSLFSLESAYQGPDFRERIGHRHLRRFDLTATAISYACVVVVAGGFIYLMLSGPVGRLLQSISALLVDGALLDVRKAVGSGREGYFAPGYIKQFRDILGPIVVVMLVWSESKSSRRWGSLLVLLLLAAILLSGQRGPMVLLLLSTTIAFFLSTRMQRKATRKWIGRAALLGVGFVVLLTTMDSLLGRRDRDSPVWTAPVHSVVGLLDRIVLTVPRSNAETFYLWGEGPPTNGRFWLEELQAVLPGPAGQMFTNVLHVAGGGSEEGNLVLGMASDLWFTWGWAGLLLFPAFFAVFLGLWDVALYQAGSRLLLAARLYLFLALPMVYSPYGLILYGGAVVAGLSLAAWTWRGLVRLGARGEARRMAVLTR